MGLSRILTLVGCLKLGVDYIRVKGMITGRVTESGASFSLGEMLMRLNMWLNDSLPHPLLAAHSDAYAE